MVLKTLGMFFQGTSAHATCTKEEPFTMPVRVTLEVTSEQVSGLLKSYPLDPQVQFFSFSANWDPVLQ